MTAIEVHPGRLYGWWSVRCRQTPRLQGGPGSVRYDPERDRLHNGVGTLVPVALPMGSVESVDPIVCRHPDLEALSLVAGVYPSPDGQRSWVVPLIHHLPHRLFLQLPKSRLDPLGESVVTRRE